MKSEKQCERKIGTMNKHIDRWQDQKYVENNFACNIEMWLTLLIFYKLIFFPNLSRCRDQQHRKDVCHADLRIPKL